VNGYGVAGQARYATIWEKCDSPAWEARHDLDTTTYQQTFDTLVGQGYRLVEVSGYEVSSGSTLYAAIWEKRVGPAWEARHGLDATTYQQTFDTLVGQGYRLIHVSGYPLAGQARYAAIWEKCDSPAWEARHGLDATTYQQTFDTLVGQGYHPVQVSGYTVGAQDLYSAIFEKSTVPAWEARHGLDAATYQQTFDTLVGQGYRLADVSGYEDGYAAIWTK
jgi:DNA-binding winged helix-turn-helix (wHTH) protein